MLSGEEQRLQRVIDQQAGSLRALNRTLVEEAKKERALIKVQRGSSEKAQKLARKSKKARKEKFKAKAERESKQAKNWSTQLALQHTTVSKLRAQIAVEENLLEQAQVRKQLLVSQLASNSPSLEQILLKGELEAKTALSAMQRMELQVLEREARAISLAPKGDRKIVFRNSLIDDFEATVEEREARLKGTPAATSGKLSEADQKLFDDMTKKIDYGVQLFQSALSSMRAVAIAADPSIERAYKRLCHQLEIGYQWAERSAKAEDDIACELLLLEQQKADTASLSLLLRQQRQRNIVVNHRLFAANCLARRLLGLKLLLAGLPTSSSGELVQYTHLIRSVCGYIRDAWRVNVAGENLDVNTFEHSLLKLESKIQMAYITLAKGEVKSLSSSSKTRLEQEAVAITKELEMQKPELRAVSEGLDAMLIQAEEGKKEVLKFALRQRKDQCESVSQSVERNIQVLAVTLESIRALNT